MDLVECVPNISEGQRPSVIEAIAAAARAVPGARLLDVHSDRDHNRSVLTIAGPPDAVASAAFGVAEAAVRLIDMRLHRGVHPRMGALDVLPFVPLGGASMELCVDLAHRAGERIGCDLGIPVYFYGEAAIRPERRLLVEVRRGEYEKLLTRIGTDPSRAPDVGPSVVGPGGATAVGARRPLVAFNVHLRTDNVAIARAIARAIRASNGGLPGVQALGFTTSHPGLVQVSMNLFDLRATSVAAAVARVAEEAGARGVELAHSELVGLMPAEEALRAAAAALGLPVLARSQVLELALSDQLALPDQLPDQWK